MGPGLRRDDNNGYVRVQVSVHLGTPKLNFSPLNIEPYCLSHTLNRLE